MRSLWVVVVVALLALGPIPVSAAGSTWEHWQAVGGVFDVGGPRGDGSLLVAGSANLYLVDPAGNVTPFARGPGGYHEDAGAEAYIAVSPGQHVSAASCDFAPDDAFILREHVPIGITRVDKTGEQTGSFVNLDMPSLNGIAFDTVGNFDHRLLVTGPVNGKTEVVAIDCTGAVQVLTRTAPVVEGGLAVAPPTFGAFAGALIAPDELSGKIYAITVDGAVTMVAKPQLPVGADIGVESVGFVPPGFTGRGGDVYYADRKTANNPHPGSDSVLRVSSTDLAAAGVQDGDMLVATEGGATLTAVHCSTSCIVTPVVNTPTTAHGEGHIAFTVVKPAPSPTPSPTPKPSPKPSPSGFSGSGSAIAIIAVVVVAVGLAAFAAGLIVGRRRKQPK